MRLRQISRVYSRLNRDKQLEIVDALQLDKNIDHTHIALIIDQVKLENKLEQFLHLVKVELNSD